MHEPDFNMKYKAQVYDIAINAFFKLREFDAASTKRSKGSVGWDVAEAFVAAAVSGVTYKSEDRGRWFEAAQMLRYFADMVEDDGLESLQWGYKGNLDARHAWRPDIRSDEGLADFYPRALAIIQGCYRPLRAQTVADTQTLICLTFVRNALEEIVAIANETEDRTRVRPEVVEFAESMLAQFPDPAAS